MAPEELKQHIGSFVVVLNHHWAFPTVFTGKLLSVGKSIARVEAKSRFSSDSFRTEERRPQLKEVIFAGGDNSCESLRAELTAMYKSNREQVDELRRERDRQAAEILAKYLE